MKPNILFVCGRNKWRSPTAVNIYKNDERFNAKSAGLSSKSNHQLSKKDIEWADIILVMETKYKSRILGIFRDLDLPIIENLDIPDDYEFMNEELIEMIQKVTEFILKNRFHINTNL